MSGTKRGQGRPTAYLPEYDEKARKYALLGLTNDEMADQFDVAPSTFRLWMSVHPSFSAAVKSGKGEADAEIVASLYHRAKGYSHPEDKVFISDGQPVIVPTVKHYPPDTAAAFIWLKNRQGKNWRDRQETEASGNVTVVIKKGVDDAPE